MKRLINNLFLTIKTIENLHIFILDYFGLLKGEVIYKIKNKRYRFIARGGTSDKDEIIAVMSGFEYKFSILPKINNPVIFDVGAYIGDSAVFASDYFHNKCRIFSFEADKENYKYCQINILLNNMSNVSCFNIAIGNKNGTGYLQKAYMPNDAYRVSTKKTSNLKCTMKPIEKVTKENRLSKIDILKMDIEGGEYEIFNSSNSYEFIKSHVRFIFLEYHYDFGEKLVDNLLHKLEKDFQILYHRDNILTLKNKKKIY